MGLFDAVRAKAGELAGDAERAGKVAAAQARVVTLQNDIRKAERELGQAAYALIEEGAAVPPDLLVAAEALAEAYQALRAKEQEIAELRGGGTGEATITYAAEAASAREATEAADAQASAAAEGGDTETLAAPVPPAHSGHTPDEEAR
jgi:hypothetical protein